MKKYYSLFVFLVCPLLAGAEVWSLDSCINYAVSHNLTIKARELDVMSGEQSITEARSSFLPTISADASQSFSFGRGLTAENVYANRNTSNFQWGANASLPLFQGLSGIRKLRSARSSMKSILYKLEAAKDDVTLNIISQYLQVLYCDEVQKSAARQLELSRTQHSRQRALSDSGKIAEFEVLQAEAQVSQDELTLSDAQNDYTLALLELAQMMQLDNIDDMSLAPLPDELPLIPSAESVYAYASVNNNAVKASEADVVAADDQIKLAQSGYVPRLLFNVGTGSSYYNINGIDNPSFSAQMRDNYNTYLGFSLNIPIFDGLATRNSVKRSRIEKLNAELLREETQSKLYQTIQQVYYQALGAKNKYETSLVSESAMSEAFNAMTEKYELGRANSTEFQQSKSDYFQATLQRIQARYEYVLRYRILMFYAERN